MELKAGTGRGYQGPSGSVKGIQKRVGKGQWITNDAKTMPRMHVQARKRNCQNPYKMEDGVYGKHAKSSECAKNATNGIIRYYSWFGVQYTCEHLLFKLRRV